MNFEKAIISLVMDGFDLETLLDMDVLSFDALANSYAELRAERNAGDVWAGFVSAQADQKTVKKFVASLTGKDSPGHDGRPRRT